MTVEEAARLLLAREDDRTDGPPLTDTWSDLDLETAYRIQDETLRLRLARGETLIGVKLGLTSRAKQQRMNVDSPLTAWLTDAMLLPTGVPVPMDKLIHPRAEPEIAVTLKRDLEGPGVTAATALGAIEYVFSGIEIIDSRYADFRFTLPDVVADNASSGAFVTGPIAREVEGFDLAAEACSLEVDSNVVDTATGAAVQGHPAEAIALAANDLGRRGRRMRAGWIVLTGGMTDAVPVVKESTVSASFSSLGRVVVGG
ncbi:4-oxalocrotonate decarboxylase [Kibdelosporangium philippinense]|uniref:4-oxalocrotonate decarboxylase n=1 Tax=Kibdelosporangium philippinense TaxID=211113 RepID=A0ABS8ZC80_9PSEU|nr:4-oxalocrotonate decarboxylase [Kibdelosporangium philippinense]MCE7004779.1 4-oxalocrotonate decarboxylase [Kibdelosporangium philippinense]